MRSYIASLILGIAATMAASAQTVYIEDLDDDTILEDEYADSIAAEADPLVSLSSLPRSFFRPSVYTTYIMPDTTSIFKPDYSGNEAMRWIEDANALDKRQKRYMQYFFLTNPDKVIYNVADLPDAPRQYIATVNPEDHTITLSEVMPQKVDEAMAMPEVKRRHWIRAFDASLQFSQAYVSPNWYQGGNNNLNMLASIFYNVKLNQEFHPNLLFESTFQYKLGVNSAPDDSLRKYNISEDLLQINSKFGVKAAKRWFYSVSALFKTQLLNSYTKNTRDLRAAFLSPGEFNAGLGMTYNYANSKKTFTFDTQISPLSYNMQICTNKRIDETAYGIAEGKKTVHKFGSSGECSLFWQMTYNISLRSRLFGFTDYNRAYADWENTLLFNINKFLTAQIYAYLRYDSQTPPCADPDWHKLQVKEILSIGFSYKFSSL